MNEVATILKDATQNSLIILDEIGRGTSTFDGMSIARAVLEYVCKRKTLGAKTLFATHYHELTAMEGLVDGVRNYSVAVKKREMILLSCGGSCGAARTRALVLKWPSWPVCRTRWCAAPR